MRGDGGSFEALSPIRGRAVVTLDSVPTDESECSDCVACLSLHVDSCELV